MGNNREKLRLTLDGTLRQNCWNIKFESNRDFVLFTALSLAPQGVPGTQNNWITDYDIINLTNSFGHFFELVI